tara:strand:- start:2181 stop:2633 length:453 start_codon:yes stop_codon:yes gene_type:complete
VIERLRKHLIEFEGVRLKPYLDTANPPKTTIGIGRNLSDNGITMEEAEMLLEHDINTVLKELNAHFSWYSDKPQTVQLVLADLCFNLGLPTLLKFKNMLESIKNNKYQEAAEHLLDSKYRTQTGRRALYNAHLLENINDEEDNTRTELCD